MHCICFRLEAIGKNSLSIANPIKHGRDGLQREIPVHDDVTTNLNANVDNIKDGSSNQESDPPTNTVSDTSAENLKKLNYKSYLKLENKTKLSATQSSQPSNENYLDSGQSPHIGFSNLPKQLYKKAVKKGFDFVLLVVGETGLGKSTLINSMFLTDIYSSKEVVKTERTVDVVTHHVVLEEGGVKLSLTVVDTPGYGDAVDNTDCWEPVVEYVEQQFDKFLEAETRVKRESLPDSRVHACLYLIAPSGHGLKRVDVEFMKRIHDKVNIIPVIGKADACTKEELGVFKQKVSQGTLQKYAVPIAYDLWHPMPCALQYLELFRL